MTFESGFIANGTLSKSLTVGGEGIQFADPVKGLTLNCAGIVNTVLSPLAITSPPCLCLGTAGHLSWENGLLKFDGDADEAAKHLIEVANKLIGGGK